VAPAFHRHLSLWYSLAPDRASRGAPSTIGDTRISLPANSHGNDGACQSAPF